MASHHSRNGEIDVRLLITCLIGVFCGGIIGYFIGLGGSLGPYITRTTLPVSGTESKSPIDEESDEAAADVDLSKITAGMLESCKLVLVVRTDLGMSAGKIAAQCSHATLACYKVLIKANPALLRVWERTGAAKITLRCESEEDLLILQAQAASLGICACTIQDAGRTQIAAGSRTVVGIGPAPNTLIDKVTKHLKLL